MESEDEGKGGESTRSKTKKRVKKLKKRKIKNPFESWDISIWLFVVLIIVSVILLLTVMLLLPFGLNPINRRAATVRSNSMEPIFERGDIVFFHDVDSEEIEEGDVIVLQVPERYGEQYGYPPVVVHRVTQVNDGHLFDIDGSKYEENLEDGQPVPEELRKGFEEEGQDLPEQANMTLSNGEWWITDGDKQKYRLEEGDEELKVYEANPGSLYFETKGDANNQADPFFTSPQNVIGEYSGSDIPYLGLLFMFANTTTGMITLVLTFTLAFIAIYFPWYIDKKEERTNLLRSLKEEIDELRASEGRELADEDRAAKREALREQDAKFYNGEISVDEYISKRVALSTKEVKEPKNPQVRMKLKSIEEASE